MSLAVVITIAVGACVLWHLMSPSEYTSGYRTRYTITKAITSYTLPLSEEAYSKVSLKKYSPTAAR